MSGRSVYTYVRNDPVDLTDPDGLESPAIYDGEYSSVPKCPDCGGGLPFSDAAWELDQGNVKTAVALAALEVIPGGRVPGRLKANMIREGVKFAKGEEAHHVVRLGGEAWQEARNILASLKIDIEEAANGAKLDEQFHRGVDSVVHGAEAAKAITTRLANAAIKGAEAVRAEMRQIAKDIEKAAKHCTPKTGTRIC